MHSCAMSTDEQQKALQREQGRRLRAARLRLGIPSAVKAAEFLKLPNSTTYSHHENGTRGIGRAAADYALKFDVPEEWLLRGKNPPDWAAGEPEQTPDDDTHHLAAWRQHARLSVEDLADRAGATPTMISSWEAGAEISSKWLVRLATVFETTAGSILDVDPGTVPPELLQMWRDTAKRQKAVRETLQKIARTGTDG